MSKLSSEFSTKDLDPLSYFLGISVTRHSGGIFLSQHKYAGEIIEQVAMSSCKPVSTLVDTKAKLSGISVNPYHDPYRSVAGALQYLTFTRPDIAHVVQQVCLFMHDPRTQHILPWSILLGTLRVQLPTAYISLLLWLIHSPHILMLTGEVVQTQEDPRPNSVSILGIIWSIGLQNDNQLYLALVLKQSIVVLLMLLLNHVGFKTYC
jgi:hypothetical protein